MIQNTKKSRALITGASRGIGAAIAVQLAKDGYDIILNYRSNKEKALLIQAQVEAQGQKALLAAFDVRDPEATEFSISALLEEGDPIGVLVNNAGVVSDSPFPSMKPEAWHRVIDTTLNGFYNVTRPLIMPMIRQRKGRIVNIASVSGIRGNRGQANYAAAKAGLIGATKTLAMELAKRKITVNAVAPGLIDTDMTSELDQDSIRGHIPMRRVGTAQEVADLVSFLVSDKASYITSQVIAIDGGLS